MPTISLISAWILAAVAGGVPDDEVREAVSEVYGAEDYQAEFPGAPPPGTSSGPGRVRGPQGSRGLVSTGGFEQFLLWALAIVVVVLLVAWALREWGPEWAGGGAAARRRSGARVGDPAPTARIEPLAAAPRPEFEIHAQAGRFEEAVHAMLLSLQWEIDRRRARPFPVSATSREIVRSPGITEEPRRAFAGIVGVVEASWFGGSGIGRPEYEECRGRYDAVLAGLPEAIP